MSMKGRDNNFPAFFLYTFGLTAMSQIETQKTYGYNYLLILTIVG